MHAKVRLVAVAVLLVVVAACGEPPLEHEDRAVHYGGVGELVAAADAVVLGRVAGTSRGRILDQEDVVFTIMDVRVAVERVWAGRMPTPTFTIERPGWERVARRPGWRGLLDRAGEREWRLADELRLEDGDHGIFFLAGSRPAPGWALLGPDGAEGRADDGGGAGGGGPALTHRPSGAGPSCAAAWGSCRRAASSCGAPRRTA